MKKYAMLAMLLLCGCAVYLPEATKQYELTAVISCTIWEYSCLPTIDIASGYPSLDCGEHPASGRQMARIKRTETKYFYKKHPEKIYTGMKDEIIQTLTECK